MHINFRNLKLHNFLSFGDAEIIFNDDGFVKVTGVNNNPDDLAVSNGSGKSSLWEAIIWTLTGDTIRGTKQVSNLYGEDGCYCEIEFDIDNKIYKLIRAKDHKVYKTSLQIFIDGKDCSGKGIRDSEKLLEQYLPDLTASLLGSVIILGQGLPQKFTNNTPSARKEILEQLSKSDFMIEDLKKKINDRKAFHNAEIRRFEDEVLKLDTEIAIMNSTIYVNNDTLTTMPPREQLEAEYKAREFEINTLDVALHELDQHIQHAEIELEDQTARLIEINNQEKTELDEVNYRLNLEMKPLDEDEQALVATCLALEKEINRIRNIKDVCPTCGQKLPNIEKPDTSKLEVEFDSYRDILKNHRIKKSNIRIEYEHEATQIKEKYALDTKTIQSKITEVKEYRNNKNLEHIDLSKNLLDSKTALNNILNSLRNFDSQIETLNKQNKDLQEKIETAKSQILYINTNKDLQQSKLSIITKFETAVKRDFRGYLLSNIIEYIQTRARYYSNMVFETASLDFELSGNNIRIAYCGKDYENLSGGEKQKVDLIIQFSIRDMLSCHLNFSSNILVLDEIFDNLDQTGCEKVIELVSNLNDIKNIFIVTHRKDLSLPSDKELIVVKSNNGISEIHI